MTEPEESEPRFGSGRPFSIGVEEELFLVDPVTGRQANASAAVLERIGEVDGQVAPELHACQVELITVGRPWPQLPLQPGGPALLGVRVDPVEDLLGGQPCRYVSGHRRILGLAE